MNRLNKSALNSIKLKNFNIFNFKIKRTFLTENYYCYEQWDKYMLSDVVKKVGPVNTFSLELNDKLDKKALVTPLDMDLLATKLVHVSNFQELEFIENIFANYRKTQSALFVRDSMHYSFVRNYIDLNQADRLLQMIKLKYKYGLFLDSYTANMLMDHFLKENELKRAALTAHEIMLQEDSENELTQAACLLSCLRYLKEHGTNEDIQEQENNEDEKKKKVLVYFLRRPYNDEHFDLKTVSSLSGKTIYFASSNSKSADQTLRSSLKVYGLLVLGKYDKAVNMLEDMLVKDKTQIHSFVIEEVKTVEETLAKNEEESKKHENFIEKWKKIKNLCDSDSNSQIVKKDLGDAVKDVESYLEDLKKTKIDADITAQGDLLVKWSKEQENELNQQIKNFTIELKKESIMQRLADLERQEETLTFFDKQQQIIDSYYGKGFLEEDPSEIPIEPDESVFKAKYERHFKPWPKYMNRPESSLRVSENKQAELESLTKIYLNNQDAQPKKEK